MEAPLTESEIEFLEHYYTPTSLFENLIPVNENAPHVWSDEEECFYLYLYQISMQNFSYLIANDPELSKQENFNKKKGAGDCFSIGARNIGKCEYIENKCQLADGSLKKFGDLINTSQDVISFNDNTFKLEKDTAIFKDNGLKECVKITTHSGKEIIVTENHPLYTNNGWVMAKDITKDLMIATPREIKVQGKDVDDNVAKLVGYLLGDGCCTTSNISVSNINPEIISELNELAEYFDCKIRHYNNAHFFSKKEIPQIQRGAGVKNNIHLIVEKYKINTLSKFKTIHPEIFKWSNHCIALMLNRLFACDGHIRKGKDLCIEITLASKELIDQIQTLLLRLGIHSNVHYKKATFNKKCFDAWRLYIGVDTDKFLDIIGIKSKDDGRRNIKSYSTSDRIPNSFILNNYSTFKNKKKLKLRNLKSHNPSRFKLQKLENKIGNQIITKLAFSDIYWEFITEIESVGLFPTVMVSVEKNHTYISNNIISHNSFMLKADIFFTWIHKLKEVCVASFDQKHLSKVTDPIASYLESHPFAKIFHLKKGNTNGVSRKTPGLKATSEHGCLIEACNEKIDDSKKAGTDFQGKHYNLLCYEEFSYASKKGTEQRVDAGDSLGYIFRPSGIPNLRIGSPMTELLKDPKLKRYIWRHPQAVRPDWSDEMKQKRIQEYNGEFCFDTETEVLTKEGWKTHETISENDSVLSFNPETGYADYYSIKNIYKSEYNGYLNYYGGLKLNFAITDKHKLLFQTHKKGIRLESLEDLRNHNNKIEKDIIQGTLENCGNCGKKLDLKIKRQRRFCSQSCRLKYYTRSFDSNLQKIYLINTFKFRGKNPKNINFHSKESRNAKKHEIKIEDWAEFLGWFLSEGSISNAKRFKNNGELYTCNTIAISQSKKENLEEIKNLLIRMGFSGRYNKSSLAFDFNSRAIVEHLKEECYNGNIIRVKTIHNCYNKKIPNYVFDWSPRLINIFLDAFNKGDGDSKRLQNYTSSIQLANGLQELIFKVGHTSIVNEYNSGTKFGKMYNVSERKIKHKGVLCRFDKIKKEKYNGLIWCLEVDPHNNFFVRRNGRCHFTGNSSQFKLNVDAESMEGADGFWDMARLKEKCLNKSKRTKYFEVHKENFHKFRQNIIVERVPGTEQVFICSDLGYGGTASEIIIIFKVGDKYKYVYNIPLFKLVPAEQIEVFYWLYETLGGAFIGLDDSTDHGVIADGLVKKGVPSEYITRVVMTANMEIDFEKDSETGRIILDKVGQPVMKTMKTKTFGMQELERIMYSGKVEVPQDEKFFEEFNGFEVTIIGNGLKFGSSTHDDLHQSFEVWAITRYLNEFNQVRKKQNTKRCYGII